MCKVFSLDGSVIELTKYDDSTPGTWKIETEKDTTASGSWYGINDGDEYCIVICGKGDASIARVYQGGEIECEHDTIADGDEDERAICLICGCTFDWGWVKETDDYGEVKTREYSEAHYEDEGCIGSLVQAIYELEFGNEESQHN